MFPPTPHRIHSSHIQSRYIITQVCGLNTHAPPSTHPLSSRLNYAQYLHTIRRANYRSHLVHTQINSSSKQLVYTRTHTHISIPHHRDTSVPLGVASPPSLPHSIYLGEACAVPSSCLANNQRSFSRNKSSNHPHTHPSHAAPLRTL